MAKCVSCQNELPFTVIRGKMDLGSWLSPQFLVTVLVRRWRDFLTIGSEVEFWKVSCPRCKKLMVFTRGDIVFYYACCMLALALPAGAVWFYINANWNPVDLEPLAFIVKFVVPGFIIVFLLLGIGFLLALNFWWNQLVRLELFEEQREDARMSAQARRQRILMIIAIIIMVAGEIYLRVRCHTSLFARNFKERNYWF